MAYLYTTTVKGITYNHGDRFSSVNKTTGGWGGATGTNSDRESWCQPNTQLYFNYEYSNTGITYNNPYAVSTKDADTVSYFVRRVTFPDSTNTVQYNLNGASGTIDSDSIGYSTKGSEWYSLSISFDTTTVVASRVRTGYTFAGWKSSKTGEVYNAGDTIPESEFTTYNFGATPPTLTLTAQWTANQHTVTLSAGSGATIPATSGWTISGTTATKTVNFGSALGTLPTPTKTNYRFDGWFDSNNNQVTSSTVLSVDQNVTYTAHWTQIVYTYTFKGNGGSPSTQTKNINAGSAILTNGAAPSGISNPTRTGYLFDGWALSSSGTAITSTIYATGSYAKNMTLYAVWRAAVSSITAGAITIDAQNPSNVNITITQAAGVTSSSDTVTITCGGQTIASGITYTTYGSKTITLTAVQCDKIAKTIPNSTTGQITFKTETTIDGSVVGSFSLTTNFTLTNVNPTISGAVTFAEQNSIIAPWALGSFIAGKSQILITPNATVTTVGGATVAYFAIIATNGDTAFTKTIPTLEPYTVTPSIVYSNFKVRVTVTDSRGKTAYYQSSNITVLPYAAPDAPTISLGEYDNTNKSVPLTITALFTSYGTDKNVGRANYLFTDTSGSVQVANGTVTFNIPDTQTVTVTSNNFNLRSSYILRVTLTDSFGVAKTTTAMFNTSSGNPVIDKYKADAVAFFGYVEQTSLDATKDGEPYGLTVKGDKPVSVQGDTTLHGELTLPANSGTRQSAGAVISDGIEPVTVGVVPISYGGTSASTKLDAQHNLGMFIGNTQSPDIYFGTSGSGSMYSPQDNDLYAWDTGGVIPIEFGGTGAGMSGDQLLINIGLLNPSVTMSGVPQIYDKYYTAGGGGGGASVYYAGTGLVLNDDTFNHSNSVTAGTIGSSSTTSGNTVTVPWASYDAQGHITSAGTKTHTINTATSSSTGVVRPDNDTIVIDDGVISAVGKANAYFATVLSVSGSSVTVSASGSTQTAVRCCICNVDDSVVILTMMDDQLAAIATVGGMPIYQGAYGAVPMWYEQTLETNGYYMEDDMTVHTIPKFEGSTLGTDGYTISI